MESRQSRMDKYYDSDIDIDDSSVTTSRTKKNQELYKEVGTLDLEDFDLNNNVSIIGESTESISLDEIQDILSEKYRDNNRSKSIGDTEEIALPKINLDETREYDLNSILEKVKESKEVDYEEERLRKVRSSQYDILKDLDKLTNEEEIDEEDLYADEMVSTDEIIEPKEEIKVVAEDAKQEKELLDLIDTIVAKELISDDTDEIAVTEDNSEEVVGELDPLDILSDLRGDDDTKVMGAIQIDEETEKTLGLDTNEFAIDEDEEETGELEYIPEDEDSVDKKIEETEEVKVTQVTEDTLSNSFATASIKITEEDFDDFDDLKEKGGFGKVIIILVVLALVAAFVFGILISLVCATQGYETKGGAKDVGVSTTQAAVLSTVYMLFADFIINIIFYL